MSVEGPVLRDGILSVSSSLRKEQMLLPRMSYEKKKKRCTDICYKGTNTACEGRALLPWKSLNDIKPRFQFEHICLEMTCLHEEISSSKFSETLPDKG